MKYQILVDSSSDMSSDYLADKNIAFSIVPLHLFIGEEEYLDDDNLDTSELVAKMNSTKQKLHTACPSIEAWSQHFSKAEYTFVVAMTSQLSGTYNSAVVARENATNKDKIFVFDSKSTSGSMELIVDFLVKEIEAEKDFDTIIKETNEFIGTCNLFFILHRFDNLIANGRMSRFAGLVAKTLVIKPICTASKEGTIEVSNKCIGSLNAYRKLAELCSQRATDFSDKKLIITHCNNLEDAEKIKELVCAKCNFREVIIKRMRGLTSFYAEDKGLIICF